MEIEKLKRLLGIDADDDSKDFVLQFILSEAEELVKNYCNIEEIPSGLMKTSYHIAIDVYRKLNPGQEEETRQVSSITEGDTSISFNKDAGETTVSSIVEQHKVSLNRFRKVRFGS